MSFGSIEFGISVFPRQQTSLTQTWSPISVSQKGDSISPESILEILKLQIGNINRYFWFHREDLCVVGSPHWWHRSISTRWLWNGYDGNLKLIFLSPISTEFYCGYKYCNEWIEVEYILMCMNQNWSTRGGSKFYPNSVKTSLRWQLRRGFSLMAVDSYGKGAREAK